MRQINAHREGFFGDFVADLDIKTSCYGIPLERGTLVLVLGFLVSFPDEIFLVILRPVSTSPPQSGVRCSFRAHELGFVRSAFSYVFATAWGFARDVFNSSAFDPSTLAFCFCFYLSA